MHRFKSTIRAQPPARCISFIFACTLLRTITAHAFTSEGHRLIEAQVYLRLMDSEKGRHKLEVLFDAGVLDAPECGTSPMAACSSRDVRPLGYWPVLHSQAEDFSLAN